MALRFKGHRGSWSVRVRKNETEVWPFEYPVVHDTCVDWRTMIHTDGTRVMNCAVWPRWAEHMSTIRRTRIVVVQRDVSPTDRTRNGYIGMFLIDEVEIEDGTITFRLIAEITEL